MIGDASIRSAPILWHLKQELVASRLPEPRHPGVIIETIYKIDK